MTDDFVVKDSGDRTTFSSGSVRDMSTGKTRYHHAFPGPMFRRWNEHLDKARVKYPDPTPGVPNWTLANSAEELQHYKESAVGHFLDWYDGKTDEDHAAAVFFNINGAENIKLNIAKTVL